MDDGGREDTAFLACKALFRLLADGGLASCEYLHLQLPGLTWASLALNTFCLGSVYEGFCFFSQCVYSWRGSWGLWAPDSAVNAVQC